MSHSARFRQRWNPISYYLVGIIPDNSLRVKWERSGYRRTVPSLEPALEDLSLPVEPFKECDFE